MKATALAALVFVCRGLDTDISQSVSASRNTASGALSPTLGCKRQLAVLSSGEAELDAVLAACRSIYSMTACHDAAASLTLDSRPWSEQAMRKTCQRLEAPADAGLVPATERLLLKRRGQKAAPIAMLDTSAQEKAKNIYKHELRYAERFAQDDKIHHDRHMAPAYNWRSARSAYEAQQEELWQSLHNATGYRAQRDYSGVLQWAEQMQQGNYSNMNGSSPGDNPSVPAGSSSYLPQSSSNKTYGYNYVPRNNALPVEYYTAVDDMYPHGEIEAFGA